MNNFLNALKKVISVIPKKISNMVLGTILLKGNGENLEMTAVDDELEERR